MSKYYLGVDGGTTKTHLLLSDSKGKILAFHEDLGTNHETLPGGYSDLLPIVIQILSSMGIPQQICPGDITAVFGLSGIDTEYDKSTVQMILKKIGFKKLILHNDSFLGIWAGIESARGICSINGTGCTLTCRDNRGQLSQLGGYGSNFGDPGGGGTVGRFVLSHVYEDVFMKEGRSLMTRLLLNETQMQKQKEALEEIRNKIVLRKMKESDFAPIAYRAALENDPAACSFLCEMSAKIGRRIACLAGQMDFGNEVQVVLAGSLHVKSRYKEERKSLEQAVTKNSPKEQRFKFTTLELPPVYGALSWAAYSVNSSDYLNIQRRIKEQWKNK